MKILVVAPDVDMGVLRGDAIHLRNVISYWAQHHQIHIISSTAKSDCPDGIKFVADASSSTCFLPDYVEYPLRSLITTVRLLRNNEYDLIYERHHLFGSGLIGSLIYNCPTTLEVNGSLVKEHEIRESIPAGTTNLLRLVDKLTLRLADRIICVSPKLADELRDRGIPDRKLNIVSNGCDINTFKPRVNAKSQLGWDKETTYLGFVGGLNYWHGIKKVIYALPYVLEEEPQMKFIIVGDGPLRSDLENRAKKCGVENQIDFIGQVPYDSVPIYMSAFDVGIILKHPYIPGSPLKLCEYLACDTPVVATDDRDFDVIEQEKVGKKARYNDPQHIARAILEIINADANKFKPTRSVAIDHSWEKVANRVLEVATE
jgi:glycosyltransferase involved in cell wall biosynthesis